MAEEAPSPAPAPDPTPANATNPKKRGPRLGKLIVKAVSASKKRTGVSTAALKKALAAGGYDVEQNKNRVRLAIRNMVSKEVLIQTKGTGASGSFKIDKKTDTKPKKPAPKAKKPKKRGPRVGELIVKAVSASKERTGVSTAALKKALAARGYDVEKNKNRVRVAIRNLVSKEVLVQTKGTGAVGSFKINKKTDTKRKKRATKKPAPKAKKPAAKKPAAAKKSKAAAAKKPAAAKKSPKKVKKPAAAKKAAKSPKKAAKSPKKAAKSPKKVVKKAPAAKKAPAKKAAKPKAKKTAAKKK